jgi:hypothetical protein
MRHAWLAGLVAIVVSVMPIELGAPPYPGALIRVCHTDYGICLIPFTVQPEAPCQCVTAAGVWVPGLTVH